jgi:hypothetical protein
MAGAREAEILKINMQCLNPENRIFLTHTKAMPAGSRCSSGVLI